jgi:hypothetical protein
VEAFGQGAAYIASSGGPQSTTVEAIVTDGNDALIPDPAGFDTVHFEIVGPAGNDARLTGINAAGQPVTGSSVDTVTHSGIAAVTFLAGTQQGPVQIRASADRADGNVDNGLQDPVSSTATVVVSDGRLYGLTLTSPQANAILVNRVSNQATSTALPSDPDATYSFTVSAVGVDRMGNPVVPGTTIRFGSIDSPVDANDAYEISGTAGDPQEGGTLFTATDGQFTTAGGGAGPGDTLLVIGEQDEGAPAGNDNLESAAKVASIQNGQTLHTSTPFNWNDTTGASVNYGPVLPYIIGRAQTGNISSPSFTNNVGTASTTLNYPVSALGHVTAIWAQGDGTNTATHPGSTDVVTDIALAAFPGVAPAVITISPNPIPGNIDIEVDVCIVDALGSPLSGVAFQFAFSNLGIGSGSVDGISSAGTVPQVTGANGCVATDVNTTGIASSSGTSGPKLSFTAGTATASADITATGGGLVLLANPSALGGTGGTVTLTLLNGNGTPVPGVQLVGTCTGDPSIGITSGPGVTNSQGQTTATITANLNIPTKPGTGKCTFTTPTGSPTVDVNLQGIDPCTIGISPVPAQCTGGTAATSTVGLAIQSTDGNPVTASFTSNPAGASCSDVASSVASCTASLSGGTYTLTAAITAPAAFQGWSGTCTPAGPLKATLIVPTTSTSGLSCTLQVCSAGPPVGGVCP